MENKNKAAVITKPILILSFISFFTDIASEMLYPISPIFLTSALGASMITLGIVEGIAEAVAGLGKGYFGIFSDKTGTRKPFVVLGYSLSALLKPLPGIWASVAGIFTARIGDRIGKGLRTAPRDALLASYATAGTQGTVFGFHRGMDTLGAAVGPALALLFLYFYPGHYREVFLIAFIPSVISIILTLLVKDVKTEPKKVSFKTFSFSFWKEAGKEYKMLIYILLFFSLFNSSDVFLIMRAREIAGKSGQYLSGMSDLLAISSYIFYNLIYAAASYPLGKLSDKLGKRKIFTAGIIVFSAVYFLFAIADSIYWVFFSFMLYGIFAASVEGVSKAWISEIVPPEKRGSAIGILTSVQSLAFIFAGVLTGAVWTWLGSSVALSVSAVAGIITAFILLSSASLKKAGVS